MTRRLTVALATVALAAAACAPETTDTEPPEPPETGTEDRAPQDDTTDDAGALDAPAGDDEGRDADEGTAADEDGGAAADEGPAAPEVDGLTFTRCEADALSVDYPEGWDVHEAGEVADCRAFHPEPIEDLAAEELGLAARIMIDPVDFEDAAEQPFGEELVREELTVDGRDALMVERRADGGAMIPEGEEYTSYYVDLDEETLILMTTTIGDSDYERDQQVLARMAETLEIHRS